MSFALGLKRLILQRIALFHSTKLTLGILRVLLCSFNDCITYFVFQINMFREFYHSIRPNIPLCKFAPSPVLPGPLKWSGEEKREIWAESIARKQNGGKNCPLNKILIQRAICQLAKVVIMLWVTYRVGNDVFCANCQQ